MKENLDLRSVWGLYFVVSTGIQASNFSRLKNFIAKFQQQQTISYPKYKSQKFKPVVTGDVTIMEMQNVGTAIK